jgi:hypothetical protein
MCSWQVIMKRLELQCPEMFTHTGACRVHLVLIDLFVQKISFIHCDSLRNSNTVLNEYNSRKCIYQLQFYFQ